MSDFTIHTKDTAPDASLPWLDGTRKKFGMVPNLFALMAEAPALLEGYITLSATFFQKTNLTDTERQIILMTVSRLNECTYCMAGHTAESLAQGVTPEIVEALRDGTPIADPKLEALRRFTEIVQASGGWPSAEDLAALTDAGYTRETVLEVVLGVGLKTISNFTNHIVETPTDGAFADKAWSPPAK